MRHLPLRRLACILPLALAFTACGGGGEGDPNTGRLTIQVNTQRPLLAESEETSTPGYGLRIDGRNVGNVVAIGATEFRVDVGEHTVELIAGPECFVLSDNPQTVTVTSEGEASIGFLVECGPGTIEVTVTTTGDPDLPAYPLSIDGADPVAIDIEGTTTLTGLLPGVRTLSFPNLPGNLTVADGSERLVPVRSGQTTQVRFDITADNGSASLHTATMDNTTNNYTELEDAALNADFEAVLIVTPNWNPSGTTGIYTDANLGVFRTDDDTWAIFDQDGITPIEVGAAFNVLRAEPGERAFVHVATTANTLGNATFLDNRMLNGAPIAQAFVTPVMLPGVGVVDDHTISLSFDLSNGRWAIIHQDGSPMPDGAAFNVYVPQVGAETFTHMATGATILDNYSLIDDARLNDDQSRLVTLTPAFNPGGVSGVLNDHPIGTWFDPTSMMWSVFNQDLAPMTDGASFHVLIGNGR